MPTGRLWASKNKVNSHIIGNLLTSKVQSLQENLTPWPCHIDRAIEMSTRQGQGFYLILSVFIIIFLSFRLSSRFLCNHVFLSSSSRSIEDLLKKWGLKGAQIPLEDFNADHGNIGGSNISDLHTIQMLEIKSQSEQENSRTSQMNNKA